MFDEKPWGGFPSALPQFPEQKNQKMVGLWIMDPIGGCRSTPLWEIPSNPLITRVFPILPKKRRDILHISLGYMAKKCYTSFIAKKSSKRRTKMATIEKKKILLSLPIETNEKLESLSKKYGTTKSGLVNFLINQSDELGTIFK